MEVELIGGPKDGIKVTVSQMADSLQVPVLASDPPSRKWPHKYQECASFRSAIYRRDTECESRFIFDGYK